MFKLFKRKDIRQVNTLKQIQQFKERRDQINKRLNIDIRTANEELAPLAKALAMINKSSWASRQLGKEASYLSNVVYKYYKNNMHKDALDILAKHNNDPQLLLSKLTKDIYSKERIRKLHRQKQIQFEDEVVSYITNNIKDIQYINRTVYDVLLLIFNSSDQASNINGLYTKKYTREQIEQIREKRAEKLRAGRIKLAAERKAKKVKESIPKYPSPRLDA